MAINKFNTEQWAPCPIEGYERYHVSDFGRIKNSKTGRILKERVTWAGYHQYDLFSGGKLKRIYIHRLVWMTFHGEIPLNLDVDHIDNNGANNRLDNLQLLSHRENCQKRRGGWKWGEGKYRNRPKAKRPMSEETKEKLRASTLAYHEAKKKALEQQ